MQTRRLDSARFVVPLTYLRTFHLHSPHPTPTQDGTPGLLVCPDTCSQDTPFEDCACEVKGLLSGETPWRNILPCMLNSAENRDFFERTMPEELLEDLAVMMSTAPVLEGEVSRCRHM